MQYSEIYLTTVKNIIDKINHVHLTANNWMDIISPFLWT